LLTDLEMKIISMNTKNDQHSEKLCSNLQWHLHIRITILTSEEITDSGEIPIQQFLLYSK